MILEIVLVSSLICSIFYLVSFKLSVDTESVTSYECGFDLNSKTRISFSYRFFLISILFLIFDVEIALMLPIPFLSYWWGLLFFLGFLLILVGGLLFEYYAGVLNWL